MAPAMGAARGGGRGCWCRATAAHSDRGFDRVVPFLVASAALGLLLQPKISAWLESHPTKSSRLLLPCGLFAASVYNGYWGAGAGVMILVLLMLTVDQRLARSNALKNMILGVADVVCAIGFVLFGPVHWWAALTMALGFLVGSTTGPALTRRVPETYFAPSSHWPGSGSRCTCGWRTSRADA
jgi:uncharacterized membrane protein YfcA